MSQVSVNVTNTGAWVGDYVVQAFMQPQRATLSAQPGSTLIKQLFDYQRVHLAPGQSTVVTFPVSSATFRMVAKPSGDRVSTPGTFDVVLTGDGGVTEIARLPVQVRGEEVVVEAFPKW